MSAAGTPLVTLDQLEVIAQGLDHPEGICVAPDGTIYVGGETGQLYRLTADDGFEEILTTGGFMLGLAADASGILYGCDIGRRTVWRIDPRAATFGVFCDAVEGQPLQSPNWGCFDSAGTFYLSDSGGWKQGNGHIVVIRRGEAARIWSRECANFPNGIAVSPDERYLYVLESTPGALVRLAIEADGSPGLREVVVEMPGTVPDGLAFCEDGSIVIACYRPDVIYRWRADLGLQVLAEDPEGTAIAAPTNVVFCGPDNGTILTPNIGRWHVTRLSHPELRGVPLFYPDL
ncbi:MAG: SMP-30/gluconolactonase/LRE family protein [Gaiellales bacterium]